MESIEWHFDDDLFDWRRGVSDSGAKEGRVGIFREKNDNGAGRRLYLMVFPNAES